MSGLINISGFLDHAIQGKPDIFIDPTIFMKS